MTADGRLEIRILVSSALVNNSSDRYSHPMTGIVEEQHLFTSTGKRLASVRASRHRVDPGSVRHYRLLMFLGPVLVLSSPLRLQAW